MLLPADSRSQNQANRFSWYLSRAPNIGPIVLKMEGDHDAITCATLRKAVGVINRAADFDINRWTVRFSDADEEQVFEFEEYEDRDREQSLEFGDGSSLGELNLMLGEDNPELQPRDLGLKLLDPVTPEELRAIEPLIAELWAALDSGSLSDIQRSQIVAMAELIKAEQLASVPGETARWELVGTVRSALRYLAKDVPRDALAWWKLIELLEKIDWTTIAGQLPG